MMEIKQVYPLNYQRQQAKVRPNPGRYPRVLQLRPAVIGTGTWLTTPSPVCSYLPVHLRPYFAGAVLPLVGRPTSGEQVLHFSVILGMFIP